MITNQASTHQSKIDVNKQINASKDLISKLEKFIYDLDESILGEEPQMREQKLDMRAQAVEKYHIEREKLKRLVIEHMELAIDD